MPIQLSGMSGLSGPSGGCKGSIHWTGPGSLRPRLWLDATRSGVLFQERTGASASTEADTSGDPVGTWKDVSGNNFHHVAASDATRGTLVADAQNGLSVVGFDGVDDSLSAACQVGTSFTLFLVFKMVSFTSETIFSAGTQLANNSTIHIRRPSLTTHRFALYGDDLVISDSTSTSGFLYCSYRLKPTLSQEMWMNGTFQGGRTASQLFVGGANTTVGSRIESSEWAAVRVGEVIVYNFALDNFYRDCVEQYLAAKWEI